MPVRTKTLDSFKCRNSDFFYEFKFLTVEIWSDDACLAKIIFSGKPRSLFERPLQLLLIKKVKGEKYEDAFKSNARQWGVIIDYAGVTIESLVTPE